jgi:Spy/CpxP family protein refolding chaperone
MTTLRLTICLVLLFAIGAVAGSSFTLARDRRFVASQAMQLKDAEDRWLQRLHDQYAADLAMTPEQIAKVQPAMEQARQEFRKTRDEAAQRSRRIMNDLYHAVSNTLSPEQQATFAKLVRERRGLRKADS